MEENSPIKHCFDFDIGYLVKSPCKQCDRLRELPACSEKCSLLSEIQTLLSKGISSSTGYGLGDSAGPASDQEK